MAVGLIQMTCTVTKNYSLFMFFINDKEKTLVFSITSLSHRSPRLAGSSAAGLSIHKHTCTLH